MRLFGYRGRDIYLVTQGSALFSHNILNVGEAYPYAMRLDILFQLRIGVGVGEVLVRMFRVADEYALPVVFIDVSRYAVQF